MEERAEQVLRLMVSAPREKASASAPSASDPRLALGAAFPASGLARADSGVHRPGCLARDPAPSLSIPNQARTDKSSAKSFQKLPLLPKPSVPGSTLSSWKTFGFFSQVPCLDAEMEPRVAAFLNSAIRWALKDFEL